MIRKLTAKDTNTIYEIINDAATAYKSVIPPDCYHEPYMPLEELKGEMKTMTFYGWEENGRLVGVMALQPVRDVTLIRHAYVLTVYQRKGIGTKLLSHLKRQTRTKRLLVGTWAAATWAVDFYKKHGFRLVDKDELLPKYWNVPRRQVETSVVLETQISVPKD